MGMVAFRCSELDRVLTCNGSITLSRMVAPRVGDEGLEGSALHLESARRIITELGGEAPDGLPEWSPLFPSLNFSRWISDYYVRHVRENAPSDWSLEVEMELAYEFEFRVPLLMRHPETGRADPVWVFELSGHPDACAISPDGTKAKGWDLKTGYDPVDEAEQNWQMLGYIALLKRAYPSLQEITFYIVQPRNDEDEGYQRVSEVTVTDLDGAVETLRAALEKAAHNRLEVNSGRIQCKWCPASAQCPASIADRDFMKMTLTEEALKKIKTLPDDATLADWVIAAKTLARPMEDAAALAEERIAKNGPITAHDGTEIAIKKTAGSYEIIDRERLWKTMKGLLPEEKLMGCAKWSFGAARDAIADHMNIPKTGKAPTTALKIFDDQIRPCLKQGERTQFLFR